MEDKCLSGIKQAADHFGLRISEKQSEEIIKAVRRYENGHLSSRERYTIQDISEILGLKRDDARWVFTRVRRLDSERFERRLMAKDEFLTKTFFQKFHPAFQKWIDEHGLDCKVFGGGGNRINLSIDQMKELTKTTGIVLEKGLTVEELSKIISENRELKEKVQEIEKSNETGYTWGKARGRDNSSWGKETTWERG